MIKAKEKERDDRLFQQWSIQLPTMAMAGEYTSFEDYKEKMTGSNIDRRSDAEILAEIDEIEKEFNKGEDNGN